MADKILYGRDSLGHKTRYSDSALFDEMCVLCLHTDMDQQGRLFEPCRVGSDKVAYVTYLYHIQTAIENFQ